ncbi:MAG TPA: DNA-formamidopyrimidine glycosylase family protein, partial [Anaerolineaceae bacterium]|nr:DNA-formamidopyrimidine glycosylase family protein [Anaerolineaceae bacterium]
MPELPEVETIARNLAKGDEQTPSVLGQKTVSSSVFWAKTVAEPDLLSFHSAIKNQSVLNVSRRGKFLIFDLDHAFLLIHLRMSGDLIMRYADMPLPLSKPLVPHDHVYLHFADNWHLAFNDTRKFGRVWLTPDPKRILSKL